MRNLYIIFLIFCLFSCEKEDKSYQGQPQVQIMEKEKSIVIPFSENKIINYTIPVQLIGKAQDKKIIIKYKTDNEDGKIISPEIMGEIDAGEFSGNLNISIDAAKFFEGETANVKIELEKSEVDIAENYKNCYLSINKESFLELFSGKYNCYESSSQINYLSEVEVDDTINNNLAISNFWNFITIPVIISIDRSNSKSINLITEDLIGENNESYKLCGSGTYEQSGNFTINYSISDKSGKVVDEGDMLFTKITVQ